MNLLELFSGSGIVSKEAQKHGWNTLTVDVEEKYEPNYQTDIMDFDVARVFKPDMIWASPPCQCFSVASIGKHWKDVYQPKTEAAENAMAVVKKTLEIVEHLKPKWWYIENPVGMLRKMDFMQDLHRKTVNYCAYGEKRMKPTDIWTNDIWWQPRPRCNNGDPCHEAAPRGSRTGTQGLKGSYERSKVPRELVAEILNNKEE